MVRLVSKTLDTSKRKGKQNQQIPERETKQEQRQKRKDLRKQLHRTKDYFSSEEKEFSISLLALQLKINFMDGDGNCLFRSIADQMTGECSNHPEVRSSIVKYIEQEKDHFSLFMDEEEIFEEYTDRMKTHGEWGGHLELYAASQSLHVNIVVHQSSSSAPRFILSCENPTRDIHVSYHGECHYNSVHSTTKDGSFNASSDSIKRPSDSNRKVDSSLVQRVTRALPWISSSQQIEFALKITGNDFDAALELLMTNPDGLTEETATIDFSDVEKEEIIDLEHLRISSDDPIGLHMTAMNNFPYHGDHMCKSYDTDETNIRSIDSDMTRIVHSSDLPRHRTNSGDGSMVVRAVRPIRNLLKKVAVSPKRLTRKAIKMDSENKFPTKIEASHRTDKKKKAHENLYADGVREVFI